MPTASPTMKVSMIDQTTLIKISGRADFSSSVPFKTLVSELRLRGFSKFVLDLSECVTMDSTFLGVLAGLAFRNPQPAGKNGVARFQLMNPNKRVADLLENLGIDHLFATIRCEVGDRAGAEATVPAAETEAADAPTREQVTRICLEAHETLMALNPDNVPKFKEVMQFLSEDLKKMTGGTGD
jgi:anti-sigma B factor antagonist